MKPIPKILLTFILLFFIGFFCVVNVHAEPNNEEPIEEPEVAEQEEPKIQKWKISV